MELRLLLLLLLQAVLAAQASSEGVCGYPGAPAHSSVRFSGPTIEDVIDEEDGPLSPRSNLAVGTVATYACERGFELLGPARRQCQEDGTWSPEGVPFCVLNVAAGKAPMQSSRADSGILQLAVDGSSAQSYSPQTCTLTTPESRPWWYVNLLEPYMVQLVRLDFGKSCCGDGLPGTIVVRVGNNRPDLGTNPICNRFTGPLEEGQPLFLPCNPPMPGAFVSVHLEASGPSPTPVQLSLCEAFVYTDQALPIERCPQFRDQPPGSTATYNGKCYIFYNRQPKNFREALAFCRARGGSLVDESNPALQGFISWELWRRHRSDTSSQYWMGAVRDPKDRTVWRWTGSGEEISVSFWSLPQGTEEDCARYDGNRGWLWSDTPCSVLLNYICQHQPRACGRPEQPPNSTMTVTLPSATDKEPAVRNYQVGTSVEYTCDTGSLLIGPSSRTCLDTGFYNEFPPVCKSIECGYPANIKHGGYTLINNTVNYLSQVLYTCEEGFEMTGRARLTCDIDERWNGPPPRCEPIRCDPPATVAHSQIQIDEIDIEDVTTQKLAKNETNRSLFVGSIVTYTCDKGYRLTGNRQLLCLPSGSYDRTPPTCTEEPQTAPAPIPKATVRPTNNRGRPFLPTRVRVPSSTPAATTSSTSPASSTTTTRTSTSTQRRHEQPASVQETIQKRPSIGLQRPASTTTERTPLVHKNVDASDHPQDNEISGSGVDNAHAEIAGVPEPNGPYRINRADQPGAHQAKLNLGAVIALGVFGGFVFLAAVITTVVILIRRNRSRGGKHYRHRASPDCNTVASFDSGSSGSRGGLNRYYRQAWENLHESATGQKIGSSSAGSNHAPLRRKETLDEPGYRDNYRNGSANMERDGSELVVSDVAAYASKSNGSANPDKKRHHHHHHHHHSSSYQSQSHHRY
ncbi:uncharacterized protein LOC100121422 [Nasonia vitripennis]|uniref:Sushi, von Willebrand factor type A, EGF and pentraxin domain-containing protein 1 n=1 Tax=Nasonia vitripennis TaxID=7425 RepID=A0A7M7HH93_NASVI|nr:uncharacterized protein LOC100121422 [Nasonia vitripennis]